MATIDALRPRPDLIEPRQRKPFDQLQALLQELNTRDLPPDTAAALQQRVQQLNESVLPPRPWLRQLKQAQAAMLKQLEKDVKLVPRHYYRNLWMIVGMTAFGMPVGAMFGMALKNMGLLGLGLPIGMAIGIAVGTSLDNKAAREGRQLSTVLGEQ